MRSKQTVAGNQRHERSECWQVVGVGPHDKLSNGGAGICTRVRKYIPAGIYDAYPPLKSRLRRQAAAGTAGSQLQKHLAAIVRSTRWPPAYLNDIRFRPAG